MKASVRRALAFADATGVTPSHLHLATWSAARECLERVPYMVAGVESSRLAVKPEYREAVAADPLAVACAWFRARGFKATTFRGTSHYVAFLHPHNGAEGLAHRGGGGSVTMEHDSKPFRTRWQIEELGDAWHALLRPAAYVGDRPPHEHESDYLKRAVAAYLGR